jgi:hypothetical protein
VPRGQAGRPAAADSPRYHLDIETDDVAAETARLIALARLGLAAQDPPSPGQAEVDR